MSSSPSDSSPTPPLDLALLDRYLAGACTPAEQEVVQRWLGADPSHRALMVSLRQAFGVADRSPRPLDVDRFLGELRDRIAQEHAPVAVRPWTPEARPLLHWTPFDARAQRAPVRRAALAAAAVVLVAASSLLAWRELRRAPAPVPQPVAVREIATRRGQRAELRLADGSHVVLGADSRLRIPANDERDLVLVGEAYFEVTHDSVHPFRVRTADGVAEDIGTQFVVTAYPDTRGTRVAVTAGAVALRRASAAGTEQPPPVTGAGAPGTAMVTPGEVAYLDPTGRITVTHHADLAPYVGWTSGRLAFDDERFADAVPVLERWYDVEIQVSDSALAQQRFVATFQDEATPDVLNRIALALGARLVRHGRVARFVARPHPSRRS